MREFDVVTKAFVPPEENPFVVPESKNTFSWVDRDTVWVGYDFGEGTMVGGERDRETDRERERESDSSIARGRSLSRAS